VRETEYRYTVIRIAEREREFSSQDEKEEIMKNRVKFLMSRDTFDKDKKVKEDRNEN